MNYLSTTDKSPLANGFSLLLDSRGAIRSWTRGVIEALGYSSSEVIGLHLSNFIQLESKKVVDGLLLRAFGTGEATAIVESVFGKGKEKFTVEVVISEFDRKETISGAFICTIREALNSRHLEVEQLTSLVSHDLKEPLRTVGCFLQLLSNRYESGMEKEAQLYIETARDANLRMQKLVESVLTFSRIGFAEFNPIQVDSSAVVRDVLSNLHLAVEESKAVISIASPLPKLKADPILLGRVFQNLISNSLQFPKLGGLPKVELGASKRSTDWLFFVRDDGPGIEPGFSKRAFELFQREKSFDIRKSPGVGLGLAISKRAVERHGGKIWFDSELGVGSTFFFTVPDFL